MSLAYTQSQLAEYFQREYSVLTSSGSFALIAALKGAGLTPGAKVVIPASCCPIVLFAVQLAGFNTVICDVELDTLSLSVNTVKAIDDGELAAIVAVHGYGCFYEYKNLIHYAKQNGILLIEDACLAYGEQTNNDQIGSLGDISIISFGYDKPIQHGYGGALLFNDASYKKSVENFLFSNQIACFEHNQLPLKKLQESILSLPASVAKRRENINYIDQHITSNHLLTKIDATYGQLFWRYPLLVAKRDEFLAAATNKNLIFTTHYKSLGNFQTNSVFPNAVLIEREIINLFVRPETPQQQLIDMVKFIQAYQYE